MLLHYDNGKISVGENMCKSEIGKKMDMLQIKDGQGRIEYKHFVINNRIYQCNILGENEEVLLSSFVEIPLIVLGDFFDKNEELTGEAVELNETNFAVKVPYVDGATQIKIVSREEGGETGKNLKDELSIDIATFTDVSSKEEESSFLGADGKLDIVFLGDYYPPTTEGFNKF